MANRCVFEAARDLADYVCDDASVSETLRLCHALVYAIETELVPRDWFPPADWGGYETLARARRACEDLRVTKHAEFSATSLDTSQGVTVDVGLFMCVCMCDRVLGTDTLGTHAVPVGYTEPCQAQCMLVDRRPCDLTALEVDVVTAAVWHNRRGLDWLCPRMVQWTRFIQRRMAEILTDHVYAPQGHVPGTPLEFYERTRAKWSCCIARIKCVVLRQAQWLK
jgi:hypothetical protein